MEAEKVDFFGAHMISPERGVVYFTNADLFTGFHGSDWPEKSKQPTGCWRSCDCWRGARYALLAGWPKFCSRQFIGIAVSRSSSEMGIDSGLVIRLSIDCGLS